MTNKAFICIMIWMDVLNFFMPTSMADCNDYKQMQSGKPYYFYNVGYPNIYKGEISCKWTAHSPPNTKLVLSCNEVNLPESPNCQGDRLAVSLTGNAAFNDAEIKISPWWHPDNL